MRRHECEGVGVVDTDPDTLEDKSTPVPVNRTMAQVQRIESSSDHSNTQKKLLIVVTYTEEDVKRVK